MTAHKPITGMPGPGGSIGQCGVCGDSFITECITGEMVRTIGVEGLSHDFCVHEKCMEPLNAAVGNWRALPEGPLRTAFERAHAEVGAGLPGKGE